MNLTLMTNRGTGQLELLLPLTGNLLIRPPLSTLVSPLALKGPLLARDSPLKALSMGPNAPGP